MMAAKVHHRPAGVRVPRPGGRIRRRRIAEQIGSGLAGLSGEFAREAYRDGGSKSRARPARPRTRLRRCAKDPLRRRHGEQVSARRPGRGFSDDFPLPRPKVISFQFNPETMTHSWQPAKRAAEGHARQPPNPLAVTGSPEESFSFTLAMDAGEHDRHRRRRRNARRDERHLGAARRTRAPAVSRPPPGRPGRHGFRRPARASANSAPTRPPSPPDSLPTVLFVWGPGRILPVKITSLTITEKLYDPVLLNPIHADAQVGLQVLTPEELKFVSGPLAGVGQCRLHLYSQDLRQALAMANLANAVESAIGMLPV